MAPSTQPIRWGILGAGKIAAAFARGVNEAENATLTAIASRTAKKANAFAKKFSATGAFQSYEELLASPDVDAVYIATPHPFHAQWAVKAAEAGKHLLIEKPIGLNHAEAMAIFDAAEQAGTFAMEAFMYRCHRQTQMLADLVRSGTIGEIRQIESSFGFKAPFDPESRLFNNDLGGGGILDVGCYPVSAARLIAGAAQGKFFSDPLRISGSGHLGETGVDEWASALLTFPGDIQARLATSVSLTLPSVIKVFGSEGSLTAKSPWHIGGVKGGKSELTLIDNKGEKSSIDTSDPRGLYTIEAEMVSEAILHEQSQCQAMSWADSLSNMKVLDGWRQAIRLTYAREQPSRVVTTIRNDALRKPVKADIPSATISGLDKPVSRLVTGCDNQTTMPHAAVMFDHFFEAGGTAFDTAHLYGDGIMERLLGAWMANHNIRDECVIIGKGAHTPNCRPDAIEPQLLESLDRLQTDSVDIYCLHRDNLSIPVGEFVDALNAQVDAGRIRLFGGSNWTLVRLKAANEYATQNGLQGFSTLSNQYSLARMVNPVWAGCYAASTPDFQEFLTETQMPLFPWSSQARGFFTPRAHPDLRQDQELVNAFYAEDNFERQARAKELAEKFGCNPVEIALAYVLHQPFPTFPLIGPRTLAELRSSIKAARIELSPEDISYLFRGA